MRLLKEKLSRHFKFTKEEVKGFITAVLLIGFLYSFRNWGIDGTVRIGYGFSIFVLAAIIAAISYFLHLAIQRVLAIWMGWKPNFEFSTVNALISLMLTILSNGIIAPACTGWQTYTMIRRYRLGKWPPGYMHRPIGWTAAAGVFVNFFIALVASSLYRWAPNILWEKLFFINLGLAIYTFLPLPSNAGFHIFYGRRLNYLFLAAILALGTALMLVGVPSLITLLAAVIFGLGIAVLYIWKSPLYNSGGFW